MFEYPYVIITILVFGFLVMGAVGLYFSHKCVKVAKEAENIGLSTLGGAENMYKKLGRTKEPRTALYIDILLDSMRRIHSEAKAEEVLSKVRRVLEESFSGKSGNVIAAAGKTSFVVVSVMGEEEAKTAVGAVLDRISPILIDRGAVNMASIHFGIFSTRSGEVPFVEGVNRAKKACTMAEQSKVPCVVWDITNGKALDRKIKIENSIQNEIDNNKFFLEYQPILSAEDRKIVGAEVLSRLNSGEEGLLSPGAFLSAVNTVGLSEKFDYYIFEKNCKWIASRKAEREKYFYTINFSRSTLCAPDFAETIIRIANEYGISCRSLAVEILEDKTVSEEEKKKLISNVTTLKAHNMRILLDDFGSGYTSFMDLADFAVDIVKIDKTVTQNATSEAGFVILKNIIRTARDLGFKTLCEGVETEEQMETVLRAGCDLVQGYLFYRPMPVTALAELVEG